MTENTANTANLDAVPLARKGQARVTTATLNVRAQPNATSAKLGALALNTLVDVWARQGSWYWVQVPQAPYLTGWCSGNYLTMTTAFINAVSDPRAENCRAFTTDVQGRITGVSLSVIINPEARYALRRVELIDEVQAQGNTVATCTVLDATGLQIGQVVELAWPFPTLSEFALPGNPNNQHMISNGFLPPAIGPLALCIRANGLIISDVVGGIGLPGNRHVSYRATFQERDASNPEPDPDGDPDIPDIDATLLWEREIVAVEKIAATLERLADHLGA